MRDRKKNKRKEKTVPVRFPQKQIEKKTELNQQQRQRPQTVPLQRVPLGSRYPWGLNLLSLDTAAVKEVTKEGPSFAQLPYPPAPPPTRPPFVTCDLSFQRSFGQLKIVNRPTPQTSDLFSGPHGLSGSLGTS